MIWFKAEEYSISVLIIGISPGKNLIDLFGHFWPTDILLDEFLKLIGGGCQQLPCVIGKFNGFMFDPDAVFLKQFGEPFLGKPIEQYAVTVILHPGQGMSGNVMPTCKIIHTMLLFGFRVEIHIIHSIQLKKSSLK